jgi:hypothetical protein
VVGALPYPKRSLQQGLLLFRLVAQPCLDMLGDMVGLGRHQQQVGANTEELEARLVVIPQQILGDSPSLQVQRFMSPLLQVQVV